MCSIATKKFNSKLRDSPLIPLKPPLQLRFELKMGQGTLILLKYSKLKGATNYKGQQRAMMPQRKLN